MRPMKGNTIMNDMKGNTIMNDSGRPLFAKYLAVAFVAATALTGMATEKLLSQSLDLSRLRAIDKGCTVRVEQDGSAVLDMQPPSAHNGVTMSRYDYVGKLDLSESAGIEFDVQCSDPDAISGLRIYFASSDGDGDLYKDAVWTYTVVKYNLPAPDGDDGWSHVTARKDDVQEVLGKPKGFSSILGVRLFFSLMGTVTHPVQLRLRNLRMMKPENLATDAWIVDGDVSAPEMKRAPGIVYAYRLAQLRALRSKGFTAAVVRESDFPAAIPESVRLVILPLNKFLPERVRMILEGFVERGGKIVFCRDQDYSWKEKMLKKGAGEDIAFKMSSASAFGELADFYEKRMSEWFPAVVTAAKKRIADREAKGLAALAKLGKEREDFAKFRRVFMYCHEPWGPSLGKETWDGAVKFLADHGVTDLVVNFAWATTADYKSDVLTSTDELAKKGDGLADCLAACRKHGVRLHAWRCCWRLGYYLPKGEAERIEAEDRLQRDAKGNIIKNWLCPNHPVNHKMHVAAMVELAKKGVAGIHYDYIRYGGGLTASCFCKRCRAAFEKEQGRSFVRWPEDVLEDSAARQAWGDFRCRTIGRGICEIAERVHKECPGVEISSSGGYDWKTDSSGRLTGGDWQSGRDWARWAQNGWIDFVMLMDYSPIEGNFRETAKAQKATDVGKAFIVPVMGPSLWLDEGAAADACKILKFGSILKNLGIDTPGLYLYDRRPFGYLPLVSPDRPDRSRKAR